MFSSYTNMPSIYKNNPTKQQIYENYKLMFLHYVKQLKKIYLKLYQNQQLNAIDLIQIMFFKTNHPSIVNDILHETDPETRTMLVGILYLSIMSTL